MYHPEKLGIEACDLESLQQEQSTQTSTVSIDRIVKAASGNPPKPPLPRDINKPDKGSLTVFEFCQILQDPECPEEVTIIKETVTEETKPHPTDSSEDSTASRYKYCREVIKPYLKHSLECESEEELLKNALDSVSEDFPDYQPCYEVFEGEKDISEKSNISRRSSYSKVDASTSYSSVMEDNKEKKCVPKSKSTENVAAPKCPTPAEECKVPVREGSPKPKCNKKKSAEGKPKKKCSPKPSSSCCCAKEPAIGVMCENPTFYLTERCKDEDSIPNIPQPEESVAESHKNTICVIKGAMEDFVGKVYQSTKDAVTLITTESAKQIDKIRKTESSNTDGPTKCAANKSSETLTSFNFFRKVENAEMEERGSGTKPELPRITDVIGTIMSKVDSTLSMLSDQLSYDNIPEGLKPRSFNDTGSSYDKPSPPTEVSNVIIPLPTPTPVPASNSVFATIKDKIVSMFYDGEKPQELSRTSSRSSSGSSRNNASEKENDDQLIDKVIE